MSTVWYRRAAIILTAMLGLLALILLPLMPGNAETRQTVGHSDAGPGIVPKGPLPDWAEPISYDVEMAVDPRRESFSGDVNIRVALRRPSQGLWLHGQGLRVSSVIVQPENGNPLKATWSSAHESGVVWIDFTQQLPAGSLTLQIKYTAAFDQLLRGLFKVEEQGEAYALAKSESIQARRFLPGFDEPRFKTPFDIRLKVPAGYEAISNAPVRKRSAARRGYETVHFDTTRPLPTYLLSIAVGPFDRVDYSPLPPNAVRKHPIPLRGYARRGRGAELEYALSITAPMVSFFEEELNVPYPYKKLDLIAAPQWPSGATELAGAITYRESRILYRNGLGEPARRALLSIHSHEIAHTWFGNLVTPPWWDDLWLKEAFATWGTRIVLQALEPGAEHELDAVENVLNAMTLDSLASARAVREPITQNKDIRNAYDAITYSKGMAIISMIDDHFGPKTFRPALGRYIRAFEDGIANAGDFFEVMAQISAQPIINETFDAFISQPGLPVIDAELNCPAGGPPSLSLKQSPYRPLGSQTKTGKIWSIPICVAFGDDQGRARACSYLSEAANQLTLPAATCPAWVLPNDKASGYFRMSLPDPGWVALSEAIADQLSPSETLAALDSASASFRAGEASADALLTLLARAAESTHAGVAAAPMLILEDLDLTLTTPAGKHALRAFATGLYKARFRALQDATVEDQVYLRDTIEVFLARIAKDPDIREDLANRAAAFVGFGQQRNRMALPADLYASALSIALQVYGETFLKHILVEHRNSDSPRLQAAIAAAIGASGGEFPSRIVFNLIQTGALGPRETYNLVSWKMRNAQSRDQMWAWLKDHYVSFVTNIPGTWPRRTPRLARWFCDLEKADEVKTLFSDMGHLAPGHERALDETIEQITLCATLRELRQDELVSALQMATQQTP